MTATQLFILSGASGCGKTTLLNDICASSSEAIDPVLRAVRAPKYSERKRRNDSDDIEHVSEITHEGFDIAYVINNVKYGIRLEEIKHLLESGLNPFIILSDFRVIREVKERLPGSVKVIYVSSSIDAERLRRIQAERHGFKPDLEQKRVLTRHFARVSAAARLGWWDRVSSSLHDLESDWHTYATDARSTEIRSSRIRAFHIRYIDSIALFDHVVLNYAEDSPHEMTQQASNLIRASIAGSTASRPAYPPIFVLAAASGMGKGTLMEMLNLLGGERVRVVSKLALRSPKVGDRRDGMIALYRTRDDPEPEWPAWWTPAMIGTARSGNFPTAYSFRWQFHGDTEYAISPDEVEENLRRNRPQVVVANMDVFMDFRRRWPGHVAFLYLHRLVTAEEHRSYERNQYQSDLDKAERRIQERERIHHQYLERISEFRHVLLNTSFQEDLFDQMFSLLEVYRKGMGSLALA